MEDVKTDCKAREVVVKGKKAAEDPMKVVERIQRKAGRKVELLTPLPPPKPEKKEVEKKEEEKPKVEEKKSEVSHTLFHFFPKEIFTLISASFLSSLLTAASDRDRAQSSYALRGLRRRDEEDDTEDERFLCFLFTFKRLCDRSLYAEAFICS